MRTGVAMKYRRCFIFALIYTIFVLISMIGLTTYKDSIIYYFHVSFGYVEDCKDSTIEYKDFHKCATPPVAKGKAQE